MAELEKKPGIDYEKLKELGVPDEVIATLDPRDGGNITPDGKVLYLNEDRMHGRECDRPLHKNHPNGLGIWNYLVTQVLATTPKSWDRTLKLFMLIVSGAKLAGEHSPAGELYKRITQFSPDEKMYSHTNVLPLNASVEEEGKTTVMPIDLIFQAIDKAEYIAQMNHCICRSAHDCKHYDKDTGCLFFNMAGVTAVKNGLAKPVTKEEAKQHVLDARDQGLMGQALYIELEQLIWGFRNDKMEEFMEICFCCPCCCVAMDVCRNGDRSIKNRFSGSGFTVVVNHDKCVGCGECIDICPQKIITKREDGKIAIDQDHCMGCGFCKSNCKHGALELKMTMPMRDSIHEYFLKEGSIDMQMEKCTMYPPAPNYEWKPSEPLDPMKIMQAAAGTAKEAPAEIQSEGAAAYAQRHPVATGIAAVGAVALAGLAVSKLRK